MQSRLKRILKHIPLIMLVLYGAWFSFAYAHPIDEADIYASLGKNIWAFVRIGIFHILQGPDHILFVIAILLTITKFRNILKLTGAFTLAHSITLVLAGSGLLTLSSRIVEPLIALSISFMAFATVFLQHASFGKFKMKVFQNIKSKAGIIFFFGLFHGLGFAGLLKRLQIPKNLFLSSLVSFNGGIELGQIIIVLIALPILAAIRKMPTSQAVTKALALVIILLGLIWAVQRIFF